MSSIFHHFPLNDDWDISWTIGLSIGVCLLIIIFVSIRTLQHLYCIPVTSGIAGFQRGIEAKHFKLYATLSVVFATISAIITFSVYPVCTKWVCGDNALGIMYAIIFWNIYILAKTFLYLIFVGRLYNPRYRRIYQYSIFVQYVLLALVFITICTMIMFTIMDSLDLGGIEYPSSIAYVFNAIYGITDSILSLTLMILFFRPIYSRNHVSAVMHKSVVGKYAVLSAVQLIVTISFQVSTLIWYYLHFTKASFVTMKVYLDIRNALQMLDCLLLIICIYCGFIRREAVCVCQCIAHSIQIPS